MTLLDYAMALAYEVYTYGRRLSSWQDAAQVARAAADGWSISDLSTAATAGPNVLRVCYSTEKGLGMAMGEN